LKFFLKIFFENFFENFFWNFLKFFWPIYKNMFWNIIFARAHLVQLEKSWLTWIWFSRVRTRPTT
jgi:hypothetical protein